MRHHCPNERLETFRTLRVRLNCRGRTNLWSRSETNVKVLANISARFGVVVVEHARTHAGLICHGAHRRPGKPALSNHACSTVADLPPAHVPHPQPGHLLIISFALAVAMPTHFECVSIMSGSAEPPQSPAAAVSHLGATTSYRVISILLEY